MTEFRLLKDRDTEIAREYLDNYHMECTFLIGNLENYGIENNPFHRRSGDYYGYFVEDKIKGIFLFTNMGSFVCHYEDDGVLKKIALLKTIKKYKPKYMLGVSSKMIPLWMMLQKTAKCSKYEECHYMILEKENFNPFIVKNDIVNAKDYEFFKAIDFLIEVEKAFGRNPKTINELKNTVYDRTNEEEYLYLLENGSIVAQGVIQTTTSRINQIGGVYTVPSSRGKGYAKAVVSKLCTKILDRDKMPTLIVAKDNEGAKKAYMDIGFKYYSDYLVIETQVI
ncbi:MAG: uncharacterized protein PWQ37_2111 [Candidatus Petromonas sp.]|jgi:ribosomal protein S18 acetylase RimI-like enzyme|nr:uncharacterized protein [Candidatus Petromonas sp.]